MSVLIDIEMPEKCFLCRFFEEDPDIGVYECVAKQKTFPSGVKDNWRPDWCPLHEVPEEPDIPIYDKETRHENCTVQILENTKTGRVSIGWWRNES